MSPSPPNTITLVLLYLLARSTTAADPHHTARQLDVMEDEWLGMRVKVWLFAVSVVLVSLAFYSNVLCCCLVGIEPEIEDTKSTPARPDTVSLPTIAEGDNEEEEDSSQEVPVEMT